MKIAVPCGREKVHLVLPEGAEILEPRPMPMLDDPEGSVASALKAPVDGPPLIELAKGRKDACVVISDTTRPVPNRMILPPILRTLESAGITRERIMILIATGTHSPNEGRELEELVGGPLAAKYRIINHDCHDPEGCRRIGELEGAPIEINTHYLDADLKILTGLIEPHPFAGFSGGAKSILPGLSSFETMKFMHSFKMIAHPRVANCILEGNPFHGATLDVARLAGADFIVNAVINREKQPVSFFAGELEAAHRAGCKRVEAFSVINIEKAFDLVITSGGGAPMDQNLYQSFKGIVSAKDVCRTGGTVILICGCSKGLGSDQFCELSACGGPDEFERRYSDPDKFVLDQWAVQYNFKAMSRMGRVLVYSPNIEGEPLASFGLTKVHDLQHEIDRLLMDHPRVAVMPQGPYVVVIQ